MGKSSEAYDLSPWRWSEDNQPPRVEPLVEDGKWDGKSWVLINSFKLGCRIVGAGFVSDGVSRPIGFLIRRMGPLLPAALVHDEDYSLQWQTREEVDDRFWRNLIRTGVPRWKAHMAWAGVRAGGWRPWAQRKAEKEKSTTVKRNQRESLQRRQRQALRRKRRRRWRR